MPTAAERWTRDEGALCRPTNSAMEAAEYPEPTEMLMRRCERSCGNDTLGPLLISSTNGEIRPGYRAFVLARPSRSVKTSNIQHEENAEHGERRTTGRCRLPELRAAVFCGVHSGRCSAALSADGEGDGRSGWAGGRADRCLFGRSAG